jgi:hypothetical protein
MASDGSAKVAQVMSHEEHVRSVSVLQIFRLSIPVFFYPGSVCAISSSGAAVRQKNRYDPREVK